MYSNIHSNEVSASDGILEFTWMLLNAAASDSGDIDYDKLTGFTAEGEKKLKEQMGPKGAEGSVAVPDLVKDTATYLGYIHAGEDSPESGKVDLEKYYNVEEETVNIGDLLDDVFYIIVPEESRRPVHI